MVQTVVLSGVIGKMGNRCTDNLIKENLPITINKIIKIWLGEEKN